MKKECTKCGIVKEVVEFKKDRTKPDGHYSSCKECNKKAWKANYSNIAERHREKNKRYAQNNPDKVKAYHKQYHKDNAEKIQDNVKKWRQKNRGWANSLRTIGKNRYKQAMPLWANREKINQFYIEAANMTDVTGEQYQIDHIIPIKGKKVCGLHVHENLQVLPWLENVQKHNHYDGE